MTIETQNLLILPLTTIQLKHLIYDMPLLEQSLSCQYCDLPVDGEYRDDLIARLYDMEHSPAEALYHTLWLVLDKTDRKVIGSVYFFEPPQSACAPIGFGLAPEYNSNCTLLETLDGFCRGAFTLPGLSALAVFTLPEDPTTASLLGQLGFQQLGEKWNGMHEWKLSSGNLSGARH